MVLFLMCPFDGHLNGPFHSENSWPLVVGILLNDFFDIPFLFFCFGISLEILVGPSGWILCIISPVFSIFLSMFCLTFVGTYSKVFSYHISIFVKNFDYYTFNLLIFFFILWLFLFFSLFFFVESCSCNLEFLKSLSVSQIIQVSSRVIFICLFAHRYLSVYLPLSLKSVNSRHPNICKNANLPGNSVSSASIAEHLPFYSVGQKSGGFPTGFSKFLHFLILLPSYTYPCYSFIHLPFNSII